MDPQIPLDPSALADNPTADARRDDHTRELHSDLAYKRLAIVNVAFFGKANAGDGAWVLIDAGLAGTGGLIRSAAEERFGENARPACIVMTHGHFDHAGSLHTLAEYWDCTDLRAPARAALPERQRFLSSARSERRRWVDGYSLTALSTRPLRCQPLAPAIAGGWVGPVNVRLALDPCAGPYARPDSPLAGR